MSYEAVKAFVVLGLFLLPFVVAALFVLTDDSLSDR